MWGVFKKRIEENIKAHSNEIVSLNLIVNGNEEVLNQQIRVTNRLIDAVKLQERKLDLLAKSFQLEYNGNTYVKRRSKNKIDIPSE